MSNMMSNIEAGHEPPETAPVWTARMGWAGSAGPPATISIASRVGPPKGISAMQVRLKGPDSEITLVPLLLAEPKLLYQAAPLSRITGALLKLSTLLTRVGWPHNPASAERGGFTRGIPRVPWIPYIMALASPEM